MTRALLAASMLLSAGIAFADIPPPHHTTKPKPKPVACSRGAIEIAQCSQRQGRNYTTVNVRNCGRDGSWAMIYGPGPTDGPVEKARFHVTQARVNPHVMGAPQVWHGTGFNLSINFTVSPMKAGFKGHLTANKASSVWNTDMMCHRTR